MMELKDALTRINTATDRELTEIVLGLLARYDALFPEEEVFFLSLPKYDKGEREAILAQFVETISRQQ
jgi:hypothetical protein